MIPKYKNNFLGKFGLCLFILIFSFGSVGAQSTVDKLRDDVSEKQKELSGIEVEMKNLQTQISQKQRERQTLANEIAIFDLQIRETETKIRAVEIQIEKLALEITTTETEIQDKQEKIELQKRFLAESLRLINEYDSVTPLEITLGNDTFSAFLDQVQYTTSLNGKTQEVLQLIKTLQEQLKKKKNELQKQQLTQQGLKQELEVAVESLGQQKATKLQLLAVTRNQEKIYQNLLSEAIQKQEQIEDEIYNLEVNIRKQLGDKNLPPSEDLLRWPMSGILTQGYGKTGFTALGYTFHNGIDIAAPSGTKIYAAADGVVHATGTGKAAYGNWIVIRHALKKDGKIYNIYTLYGHLQCQPSNPKCHLVSAGQVVNDGELIGFEGNTGNTTRLIRGEGYGFHVHFMVLDAEGFGIAGGAHQDKYGPYQIPYGYTYNPLNFLR